MSHATHLWSIWQELLGSFAWAFTRRGFRRFAEWVTAMALNVEEHTVTQSVLALDRPADIEGVIFKRVGQIGNQGVADLVVGRAV